MKCYSCLFWVWIRQFLHTAPLNMSPVGTERLKELRDRQRDCWFWSFHGTCWHCDYVSVLNVLERKTPLFPPIWTKCVSRPSNLLHSFLFRSLPASSISTTLHQFGLSTRRALQCFWTQCACLQHRLLRPSRYLATTSCRSRLHSSSCLRPLCSPGELWRVRPSREVSFQAPSTEPCCVRSLSPEKNWATKEHF